MAIRLCDDGAVERWGLREFLDGWRGQEFSLYSHAVNPQFVRILRMIGFDRPWQRASGAYLYEADGTRYLDLFGGFGMFNVGRNNPRVRQALIEAFELETPGSVQAGISLLPGVLARELVERAPPPLAKVVFCNTGAETIEAAIKLGRAATGRSKVVSLENGFHGQTLGALSATGKKEFTDRFRPLLSGFTHVPFNDLEALERELRSEQVAVFVLEPVQGQGVHLPAPGYLQEAHALCRRYGTLFCVDEVQTGFGRTGRLFACEHWGLEPDLMALAKSLSGGYVPVAALLLSQQVYDAVYDSLEHAISHGSTFAPNDLGMVAGLATLRELDDEGLIERSERLGTYLLERTQPFMDRYDFVRDVRGLGLMWAMEFASDSRYWQRLDGRRPGIFAQLVAMRLLADHQILSQPAGLGINALKAIPPLTLTEEDVDHFVASLDAVLRKSKRMTGTLVGLASRAARSRGGMKPPVAPR